MTEPFRQVFEADDQLGPSMERLIALNERLVYAVEVLGEALVSTGDEGEEAGEKGEKATEKWLDKVVKLNQAVEFGGRVARFLGEVWEQTAGAAAEERQGIIELDRALRGTLEVGYGRLTNQIERYASTQEDATLFADDETRAVLARVARSLRDVVDSYEEVERVARIAQDVQQDTGQSAQSTSEAIAAAVAGQERALRPLLGANTDLLDQLSGITDRGDRLNIILEELEERYGGAAREIDGQLLATNNLGDSWDRLKENIGGALERLTPLIALLADGIGEVADATDGTVEGLDLLFSGIVNDSNEVRRMSDRLQVLTYLMGVVEDQGNSDSEAFRQMQAEADSLRDQIEDLAGSIGISGAAGNLTLTGSLEAAAEAMKELNAETRQGIADAKRLADEQAEERADEDIREFLRLQEEADRAAEERARNREVQRVAELEAETDFQNSRVAKLQEAADREVEIRRNVAEKLLDIEVEANETELAFAIVASEKLRAQQERQAEADEESAKAAKASRDAAINNFLAGAQSLANLTGSKALIKAVGHYADAASEGAEAASSIAEGNPFGAAAHILAAAEHIFAAHTQEAVPGKVGGGGGGAGGGGRGGFAPSPPDPRIAGAPERAESGAGSLEGFTAVFSVDGEEFGRITTKSIRKRADYNAGDGIPASFVIG